MAECDVARYHTRASESVVMVCPILCTMHIEQVQVRMHLSTVAGGYTTLVKAAVDHRQVVQLNTYRITIQYKDGAS